jgi:FkbM family methyltransferase
MNLRIKDKIRHLPLAGKVFDKLRSWRNAGKTRRDAMALFENPDVYLHALSEKSHGTVELRARGGLTITIRRNLWDARIIKEIFFDRPYVRHVALPENPVVIDIGGYIGDFTLYAAKYLNARKVIVYEPTKENFELLSRNIGNNSFNGEVIAVNKAVGIDSVIRLNVEVCDNEEIHVSSYWYQKAEQRVIPCVTLPELMEIHGLESVDLLKVDCEGGEYDIFPALNEATLGKIRNIVFEYHQVDGFEKKLRRVLEHLKSVGYTLRVDGQIAYASRT